MWNIDVNIKHNMGNQNIFSAIYLAIFTGKFEIQEAEEHEAYKRDFPGSLPFCMN